MSITFMPVTARIRQRLDRKDFQSAAFETTTISPPFTCPGIVAPCLPDDPDRVIGVQDETTVELERARVMGKLTDHGATVIRRFRNVTLIDGCAYNSAGLMALANRVKRRHVVRGERIEMDSALLCTNSVIDRYFGHWLIDGLLLETMAAELRLSPLTVSGHRWLHEPGYRDMLDMHDQRQNFVHVNELVVADDRGLNESWRRRAQAVRSRLRAAAVGHRHYGRPVFVRRGSTGARRELANEQALSDALAQRGFISLAPEEETPMTIATILSNAPMIITVEGSAHEHAMLAAARGAWVITIMPPRRMNSIGKTRADALGINWAYTVADDMADGSFFQQLDRLLRLMDMVDARTNAFAPAA